MDRILIVNSSYETMHLLEAWLERKEFEVRVTGELEQVISIMKDFRPSLLLVDVEQSRIIQDIRADATLHSTPVLMMTGITAQGKRNMSEADDTIEKPFQVSTLQTKVANLISQDAGQLSN